MTLIKIKNKYVLGIPVLMRYVLRQVYEPKTLASNERTLMEDSIVNWNKKADLTEEEKNTIETMGWMLQKNEEGYFDKRKEDFKKHGIMWQKYHRLREYGPYAF